MAAKKKKKLSLRQRITLCDARDDISEFVTRAESDVEELLERAEKRIKDVIRRRKLGKADALHLYLTTIASNRQALMNALREVLEASTELDNLTYEGAI